MKHFLYWLRAIWSYWHGDALPGQSWRDYWGELKADSRRAIEAYAEYKRDPSTAQPFEEFEAELIADGLLTADDDTDRQ